MSTYWEQFAKSKTAKYQTSTERITADTSPIVKYNHELTWRKENINYTISSWVTSHSRSYLNSYYTEFKVEFKSKGFVFEFKKIDALERIYSRIRRKTVFGNMLINSNDFSLSKKIFDQITTINIDFESIKMNQSRICITTLEDIEYKTSAHSFIELLNKIMNNVKH